MLRVDMVCFVYATIGIGVYDPLPIFFLEKNYYSTVLDLSSPYHSFFSVLNSKGIYMSANGGGGVDE